MLRFAAFAVLFAATCAVPTNDDSKSGDHDVIVVDNINDYLAKNPGAELIGELNKEAIQDTNNIRRYRFGVVVFNDCIVASRKVSQKFSTPSHASATIDYYPKSGNSSFVTLVTIDVEQSSDIGRAYVVSGGVHHRGISVFTEAKETRIFKYSAEIRAFGIEEKCRE